MADADRTEGALAERPRVLEDPIVPVVTSKPLAEGRSNVTRRVYPGLRHETHNEPEGKSVVDDTTAWLREAAVSRR